MLYIQPANFVYSAPRGSQSRHCSRFEIWNIRLGGTTTTACTHISSTTILSGQRLTCKSEYRSWSALDRHRTPTVPRPGPFCHGQQVSQLCICLPFSSIIFTRHYLTPRPLCCRKPYTCCSSPRGTAPSPSTTRHIQTCCFSCSTGRCTPLVVANTQPVPKATADGSPALVLTLCRRHGAGNIRSMGQGK